MSWFRAQSCRAPHGLHPQTGREGGGLSGTVQGLQDPGLVRGCGALAVCWMKNPSELSELCLAEDCGGAPFLGPLKSRCARNRT